MRSLVMYLAVVAALAAAGLGATIVWSDAAQPSADDAEMILWGT